MSSRLALVDHTAMGLFGLRNEVVHFFLSLLNFLFSLCNENKLIYRHPISYKLIIGIMHKK